MTVMKASTIAPNLDDIMAIATAAMATIPSGLARMVDDVPIRVADFPDDDVCLEMGLESPFDLLGLYSGVPFGERESAGPPHQVDMIFLYRRPILDYWCESGEALDDIVRHVLIHEIGHHFGFSDEDMEALEAEAD